MSDILDALYNRIKDSMISDKKYVDDSIILSFLNVKSNARLNYLRDGSCDAGAFGDDLSYLIDEGYVTPSSEPRRYCLSAKYVWDRERDVLMNGEGLLNYLETKVFLADKKNKKLSERHKVIVLFMIICRMVDPNTQLNLKENDAILDRCEELLLDSYDILLDLKVIVKLRREDLFGAHGNEHKVSNLLRHTDAINKSGVPFRAPGKQTYYLDIAENGIISKQSLKLSLQKVLECDRQLTLKETDCLYDRMSDLSNTKAIYINEQEENAYLNIDCDKAVKETLDYLYA